MHTVEELEARIGALEDEVKAKNARIAELHAEADEARQLVEEMRQQVITNNDIVDGWIEAFGMALGDDGLYHWEGVVQEWEKERDELQADYDRLQSLIRPQLDFWASRQKPEPGRPIAASASQQTEVREFRREGKSLRWIAKATGLGLNTVRTITGKDAGTDRTSIKREIRRQHELNRARMRTWRARKRVRDGLPKRLKENLKKGEELVVKAGVSRAR